MMDSFLLWLPSIRIILPIVPRKMSFWGSPQINHLLSHHLPDSWLFVLNSRPWLGKVRQVPTREFPTKFPDWELVSLFQIWDFCGYSLKNIQKWESVIFSCDSRRSSGNLDCHSVSDSRRSTCNSEIIATCCFSHGPSLTPIKLCIFIFLLALASTQNILTTHPSLADLS